MERKLFNYIMMPAMILTFVFGILLIHSLGFAVFSEQVILFTYILCEKPILYSPDVFHSLVKLIING